MKKIIYILVLSILLIGVMSVSEAKTYEWYNVEKYVAEILPQSEPLQVNAVYPDAIKDNQELTQNTDEQENKQHEESKDHFMVRINQPL